MTKPDDIKRVKVRYEIFQRDRYMCRKCHRMKNECVCELDIHHIDGDHKNNSPENLITLCRKCHMKTNHNHWYWKRYYQKKNRRYYAS